MEFRVYFEFTTKLNRQIYDILEEELKRRGIKDPGSLTYNLKYEGSNTWKIIIKDRITMLALVNLCT